MRWIMWVALVGCASDEGQRVRALLLDHVAACEIGEDGVATATVALEQPEDYYVAEALVVATGDRLSLPGVRRGRDVTFTCPEGLTEVTVRVATVLTSRAGEDDEGPSGPTPP